ncbi:MAG: 16S rRNA (guanine(966)-N(2))-methyltransferase RsmD [Rhodospirillales bacterium]|jgi:16S rRNA (guanine966-N2)-methyltransferase|nr:16S rRNA (guanine(966)-N(2))-methyltransferase RsmD [Rhodospirillales bacterium]
MRVTGGRLRGRAIAAPKGRGTRPTSDRARESLFSILQHGLGLDFAGQAVIDCFAGSGALGFEALSRGATSAVFVENNGAALACLGDNAEALDLARQVDILRLDATRLAAPPKGFAPAGLAFLDPPYANNLIEPALARLAEHGWLAPGALCVGEMGRADAFSAPAGFEQLDERAKGETRLVFLRFLANI